MHWNDIKLPEDNKGLKKCYYYANSKINRIWDEYVYYCETITFPQTALIFSVIFCEMEFWEKLLERIRRKLPMEILLEMEKDDDLFSNW